VNEEQRSAVLETIVLAEDVTTAERLRALELLRELQPVVPMTVAGEIGALPTEVLDDVLDELLGDRIAADALNGTGWSTVGEAVDAEVERRARARADEIVQLQVEARARELAEQFISVRLAEHTVEPVESTQGRGTPVQRSSPPGLDALRRWRDQG
jgi:hypothetical protein